MYNIKEEDLNKFKDIFKKNYKYEFKNDTEARESAENLLAYMELMLKLSYKDYLRKEKLKKFPKGFKIDEQGTFTCLICHESITTENGYYNKYGFMCSDCNRNLLKKILTNKICKDRDSWLADWELKSKLNIHPTTVKKLIREGNLKSLDLKDKKGNIYFQIFPINKNTLLFNKNKK